MEDKKQSLSVPIAIIVAGLLVAFGVYWSGRSTATTSTTAQTNNTTSQQNSLDSIEPIQPTDHIIGDPKADIVIIEYSDTECPYCKDFHNTLHQLVTAYNSKVAWVFRYLPDHTKSINEAEGQECAAEQGGNDAFWKFTDAVFQTTNSDNSLDSSQLPVIASQVGLNVSTFNTCLASGKYENKIIKDKENATNAGASGTPYSVIFAVGEKIPLDQGALPYLTMKNIIDTILNN